MKSHTSDKLHALIHSLSPTEKRFFKRYLVARKEEANDYLRLFDLLNRLKQFDQETFIKQTCEYAFHRNIEVKKHYLFDAILKAMRHYRDKKNGLINSLLEIDILTEKGLFKIAYQRLIAAKKKTIACDQFSVTLQLLERELQLSRNIPSIRIKTCLNLQRDCLAKNQNLLDYTELFNDLRHLIQENSFVRNTKQLLKYERIKRNRLFTDEEKATSLSAKLYFYEIRYLYYASVGESKSSSVAAKKMHALLVKHPKNLSTFGLFYLRSVAARLSTLVLCGFEKKEFTYLIKELKRILIGNTNVEHRKIAQSYLYQFQLIFFMKANEFSKALTLIAPIIRFLKENEVLSSGNAVKYLRFDIAKTFFVTGNYKEAMQWFHKITITGKKHGGNDIYAFSRILTLLSLILSNETENIPYEAGKLKKELSKLEALHEFETFLISRISRKFIHWHGLDRKQKAGLLEDFKRELSEQLSQKWRANTLLYFDFEWWIDKQLDYLTKAN
jgi:hypothetical protein